MVLTMMPVFAMADETSGGMPLVRKQAPLKELLRSVM